MELFHHESQKTVICSCRGFPFARCICFIYRFLSLYIYIYLSFSILLSLSIWFSVSLSLYKFRLPVAWRSAACWSRRSSSEHLVLSPLRPPSKNARLHDAQTCTSKPAPPRHTYQLLSRTSALEPTTQARSECKRPSALSSRTWRHIVISTP